MDRDVAAVINIACKGRARLERSKNQEGVASEAMRGNPMKAPVILRVDAAKLAFRRVCVRR